MEKDTVSMAASLNSEYTRPFEALETLMLARQNPFIHSCMPFARYRPYK